jgi:DNA-binding NarL/FixJ family response regulator
MQHSGVIFRDLEKVNCDSATPLNLTKDGKRSQPCIDKQLTLVQRYQIAVLKKAGHSNKEIAENIGTSELAIR